MDIFDSRYYKSCKVLMEILGLWPYQTQKRKLLCCIIFYSLHGSLIIPQVNGDIYFGNQTQLQLVLIQHIKFRLGYASFTDKRLQHYY